MKTEINARENIIELVDAFYKKVQSDTEIGYLFTDIAKVNWDEHLPKMYNFWENILFYTGNYTGSPMVVHRELHKKSAMSEAQFDRWVKLFTETVDELFHGERACELKNRATQIAAVMMYKTLASHN